MKSFKEFLTDSNKQIKYFVSKNDITSCWKKTLHIDGREIKREKINSCTSFVNHSPDGFQWGYLGSGPAQLAFAILFDFIVENNKNNTIIESVNLTKKYYQKFKEDVISKIHKENDFNLDASIIDSWLIKNKQEQILQEQKDILTIEKRKQIELERQLELKKQMENYFKEPDLIF